MNEKDMENLRTFIKDEFINNTVSNKLHLTAEFKALKDEIVDLK